MKLQDIGIWVVMLVFVSWMFFAIAAEREGQKSESVMLAPAAEAVTVQEQPADEIRSPCHTLIIEPGIVSRLFLQDNKLYFDGDMDWSAQAFFEALNKMAICEKGTIE